MEKFISAGFQPEILAFSCSDKQFRLEIGTSSLLLWGKKVHDASTDMTRNWAYREFVVIHC